MINSPSIAIIGLGYVGLPLALAFGKKYSTIGFDINPERISELKKGYDSTLEISKDKLKELRNLKLTSHTDDISSCNVYIVTVPTPIDKNNLPDMSLLASASSTVGSILNKGDVVVYESTVYPGATEEYCVPIIEKHSNLKYNQDFFCGYSPERINPGDEEHTLTKIIKIVSGSNWETTNFVDKLYSSIITAGTYKVSSIAVAESAKVIENIQRDVNISLINELAMIFHKLNLDTNEILDAASTKWNFSPFRPGLVGGHCIGVDPYYLTYKASEIGYHSKIILAGRQINNSMGNYIAESAIVEMSKNNLNPEKARITIFGLTFKENCPDLRNTKVPDIIKHLESYGCNIVVTDPYADEKQAKSLYGIELVYKKNIKKSDVIIVAVSHQDYKLMNINEWKSLLNDYGVFMDVKGIVDKETFSDSNIKHWRL